MAKKQTETKSNSREALELTRDYLKYGPSVTRSALRCVESIEKALAEKETLKQESDGDYILTEDAVWVTVNNFSVWVRKTPDGGVAVDIYKLGKAVADSLDSAHVKGEKS